MTSVAVPILIALGANLPNDAEEPARQPAETLRAALDDLADEGLPPLRVSPFYATPCFPAGAGPDYVNAVAELGPRRGLSPADLLTLLHRIEARHGRSRGAGVVMRWSGRTLDLDLLACGQTILPDPETQARWRDLSPADQARLAPERLILPHPRLADRAFVLVPLCDIAPDWRDPVSGRTAAELCAALSPEDRAAPRRLS
jgi:2-amino-4-hydroxy-6-hydroxymethyldihydropteridine diphosphokinase